MDAAKYSAIELLRDGRRIEIRALKPEDRTGWLEYIETPRCIAPWQVAMT